MQIWTPPRTWIDNHTTAEIAYTVTVAVNDRVLLDAAWERLEETLNADGEALLDGGAALERRGENTVCVSGGGEDALDSLEHCVNVTLGEALAVVDITEIRVVEEQRIELDEPNLRK